MSPLGLIGSVVDWSSLGKLVWTASLAGIGVTLIFSIAILGATRAVDSSRDGRPGGVAVFGVLGLAALAVVAAAVVYGIVVMAQK
jgi:hypothetical protein